MFDKLPVELIYQIFDHLDHFDLLCILPFISINIKSLLNNYHQYQVCFFFLKKKKEDMYFIENNIIIHQKSIN